MGESNTTMITWEKATALCFHERSNSIVLQLEKATALCFRGRKQHHCVSMGKESNTLDTVNGRKKTFLSDSMKYQRSPKNVFFLDLYIAS